MALNLPTGPVNYALDIPQETGQTLLDTVSAISDLRKSRIEQERQQVVDAAFEKLRQPGATAKDYADLAMILPRDQAESVRESFQMMDAEKQKNALLKSGQIFSSFKAGRPDVAIDLIDREIAAKTNAGDKQGAEFLQTWRDIAKIDPKTVEDYFGFMMTQIPGGSDIIDSAIRIQEDKRKAEIQPFELTKKQAEAEQAAVKARFAESAAAQDLAEQGWRIKEIQNDIDISKLNAQIAAANSRIAAEGNELKRQEAQVRIDEMTAKRDATVREKAADLQSALFNIDNMLNTAEKFLSTPKNIVGRAAGPISSRAPTLRQSTSDLENIVETLKSQAFLAQIPNIKGFGQLSNAEGMKLQQSLQNLELSQSPEQLTGNVREIVRLMEKARENIIMRYGAPEQQPNPQQPQGGSTIVKLPDGRTVSFKSAEDAAKFKAEAGLP